MSAPRPQSALPLPSENEHEEVHRVNLCLSTVFGVGTSTGSAIPGSHQSSNWWEQRQLADAYLTRFQSTPTAWMICDRILQESLLLSSSDHLSATVQQQRRFFAAQTLHTKCRSDAHQLPRDSFAPLRDSLLNHLRKYSTSNDTALVLRLAMAISALAVQMYWSTVISDILQDDVQDSMAFPVLLVLSVLPEECASDRLLLEHEEDRYAMQEHFVSNSPAVLNFFHSVFERDPNRVFQAFHVWIRYVSLHPSVIIQSPLLELSIQALQSQDHMEAATDVIVEILRMYPSHHEWNNDLVQKMIPFLTQLPLEQALQSGDEDIQRAYCRIATEMGESYLSLILSREHQQSSKLVEWILLCSGIEDQEISGITLHFWYRMVMDLENIDPFDWRQVLVDFYTPHLLKLVDVCSQKLMKYPDDLDDLPRDMVDELIRHRFYVSETVEDCCRLLGGHVVLQQLGNRLVHEAQQAGQSGKNDWRGIESCLSCILALSNFVPADEAAVLPFCFSLVPKLPTDTSPLRYTTSKMIGKYASWLASHHEYLQPLMPYLAEGLLVPECAPAAAIAIKELCECSNQSFAIAEPVLNLYQQITSAPGSLDLADELQILEGVCRALSRQIQDKNENGRSYLEVLAKPVAHRLGLTVGNMDSSPRRIIPEIDRIAVIVQFLTFPPSQDYEHPILEFLRSTWQFLDTATRRFPSDNMLAEKICRLHKYSMRTLGSSAYMPLLENLMQQLVHSYEISHQSPFLYAASIILTEYGSHAHLAGKLFEMISELARISFTFLRNLNDLTTHPDCVEELFYLMGRVITHSPFPLVEHPLMHSLFQCAVVGMQLDHQGANKGTIKFLDNSVSFGLRLREQNNPKAQALLESVFVNEGREVVNNLLRAVMGDLPAYSKQVPEILWKFSLLCSGRLSEWLKAFFHDTPVPGHAKDELLLAVDQGLARDEFSIAVRAFETSCRRERRFR